MALALLLFGLQAARHDLHTEIGAYGDEAPHFVSSLFFHDFYLHPLPLNPMARAREYYLHYPKIGFGQWPPFFHAAAGAWMTVAGPTPAAMLVFCSLLSVLLALLTGSLVSRVLGCGWGVGAAAMALLAPEVIRSSRMFMTDTLLALLMLLAVHSFQQFLGSGRRTSLAWSALWTVLACYTKSNSLILFPIFGLAILLSGNWRVLARPALYVLLGGTLALILPWQLMTAGDVVGTLASQNRGGTTTLSSGFRTGLFNWPVLWCAVLGLLWLLAGCIHRGRMLPAFWACQLPLLVLNVAAHMKLVGEGLPRFFLPTMPAVLALAGLLLAELWNRQGIWRAAAATVGLVLLTLQGIAAVRTPARPRGAFGSAAEFLTQESFGAKPIVLISSLSSGEGQLVAEVAWRAKPRFGRYVLRGTKVLGSADFNGERYVARFAREQELDAYLASVPVHFLVVDHTPGRHAMKHHNQVQRLTEAAGGQWKLIRTVKPPDGEGCADCRVEIYLAPRAAANAQPNLGLTLEEMVRRPKLLPGGK